MLDLKMPAGFLGTRADFLFDFIGVAMIVLVGVLLFAMRMARNGNHRLHRQVMIGTLCLLAVVLVAFETHLRTAGGPKVLFSASSFAGTRTMAVVIYTHLAFAVSTVVAWMFHAALALRRSDHALPGAFSALHRTMGRAVFFGYIGVVGTAAAVYWVAFVA